MSYNLKRLANFSQIRTHKCFVLLAIVACFAFLPNSNALAQSSLTEHTLGLSEGSEAPAGSLADVAWMHGFWKGTGLGGQVVETWNEPTAGKMIGMFQLVKDDELAFSEFMEISQDGDSLTLRVKHFNPDFTGWESKDDSVDFKLVKIESQKVFFNGLTIGLDESGDMRTYLAMKQKDGSFKEVNFFFQKHVDGKPADGNTRFAIKLPEDPNAVVFSYDLAGGYGIRYKDFKPTPFIQILASGKVLVGTKTPKDQTVSYQLSKDELMSFLRVVVNKYKFTQLETETIKEQSADAAKMVADAPTHVFKLKLADREHQVDCFGLMIMSRLHATVEGMKMLSGIRRRCEVLRHRSLLGTPENAEKIIAKANAELKKKHPIRKPFGVENINSSRLTQEGQRVIRFYRSDFAHKNAKSVVTCTVTQTGEKLKVQFSGFQAR